MRALPVSSGERKSMRTTIWAVPLLAAFAFGCGASRPPTELTTARAEFARLQRSDAVAYAPARVVSAKRSLDIAERAFRDSPGSFKTKSLSYNALRQSQLAQAYGDLSRAERDREAAVALYQQRQSALRESAQQGLQRSQSELETARRELAVQSAARAEAERRFEEAMQGLGRVSQDERGTVVTLQGAVLFQTGKSALAPATRGRLDAVAEALKKSTNEAKTITIEGHTDSTGSEETNMRLSQARADAVRDYLVEQGVSAEKIKAVGRGEGQPIADNSNVEGRATNRRVELVIGWGNAPSRSR